MSFSIVVRRTHMYLALFLTPWILMYALAVFGINHRDMFMPSKGRPGARLDGLWAVVLDLASVHEFCALGRLRDLNVVETSARALLGRAGTASGFLCFSWFLYAL